MIMMEAPREASSRAIWRPRPRLEPVMRATLLSRRDVDDAVVAVEDIILTDGWMVCSLGGLQKTLVVVPGF